MDRNDKINMVMVMYENRPQWQRSIDKLYNFLECFAEGKNKKLTICEYRELQAIGNKIIDNEQAETIMQNVMEICKTSGLTVIENGIGWIIQRN